MGAWAPAARCWFSTDRLQGDLRPLLDAIAGFKADGWFPDHRGFAAGVVAAGFGTWLMLREPDKQPTSRVSVAPGPGWTGVSLGWRF